MSNQAVSLLEAFDALAPSDKRTVAVEIFRRSRSLSVDGGSIANSAPEQEWLRKHRNEYLGNWVALDGHRLVAHGAEGKAVFQAAKEAGVQSPFLVFIDPNSLPSGGL